MKALYCRACSDLVALQYRERVCECGESRGRYLADGWHAEIIGPCRVVGIPNPVIRGRAANPNPEAAVPAWFMADGERIRRRDRLGQIVVDFRCCGGATHDEEQLARTRERGGAGAEAGDPDRRLSADEGIGVVAQGFASAPDVHPGLQRRDRRRGRASHPPGNGTPAPAAGDAGLERQRVRSRRGPGAASRREQPTAGQAAILSWLLREGYVIRLYGEDARVQPGNAHVHAGIFRALREHGWIERRDKSGRVPEYAVSAAGRRAARRSRVRPPGETEEPEA